MNDEKYNPFESIEVNARRFVNKVSGCPNNEEQVGAMLNDLLRQMFISDVLSTLTPE